MEKTDAVVNEVSNFQLYTTAKNFCDKKVMMMSVLVYEEKLWRDQMLSRMSFVSLVFPMQKMKKRYRFQNVIVLMLELFLLFFAVYVIYKKNYSFSGVVFLFFIRPEFPTLLIQK